MFALHEDKNKYRQKIRELDAEKEERKKLLESLSQRIDDLRQKTETIEKSHQTVSDFYHKDAQVVLENIEKERKMSLQKEAQINMLEKEYNELIEMKLDQQRKLQRWRPYQELMEQVLKLTPYKDIQSLRRYTEGIVQLTNQLHQKNKHMQEQISERENELLKLQKQKERLDVHLRNQQLQIQKEMASTLAETNLSQAEWTTIQETATAKTLLLGKIKTTFLNLQDMIFETVGGKHVDTSDTDSQLDYIKMFIKEYTDLLTQYEKIKSRVEQEQMGQDGKKLEIQRLLTEKIQERERTAEELEKEFRNKLKIEFEKILHEEQEKARLGLLPCTQAVKNRGSVHTGQMDMNAKQPPVRREAKLKSDNASAAEKVTVGGHSGREKTDTVAGFTGYSLSTQDTKKTQRLLRRKKLQPNRLQPFTTKK